MRRSIQIHQAITSFKKNVWMTMFQSATIVRINAKILFTIIAFIAPYVISVQKGRILLGAKSAL